MGRACHLAQMQHENYRNCTSPHSSTRNPKKRKRAGFHLLSGQYASRWRALLLLTANNEVLYTASISATTLCSFNFASMQLTSGIRVNIAIPVPFQCCYVYIVLVPALLAEGLYSTTAKVYGRGSPPPPRSFLHGISKNKYSPFPKHANYCRRRGKVGYCIVWKPLGACTLRSTAVAGETRVMMPHLTHGTQYDRTYTHIAGTAEA